MSLIRFIKRRHIQKLLINTVLFFALFAAEPVSASDRHFTPLMSGVPPKGGLEALKDDFTVSEDFSSNLPIVIVDAEYDLTAENVNVPGRLFRLSIIEGNEVNTLNGVREVHEVVLTRTDSGRPEGDKGHYDITLAAGDSVNILGMPAGNTWILQGSVADKSMIRNALAYTLAESVIPGQVPQFRFVELLLKKEGAYHYKGIYLFTEKPERILAGDGKKTDYILKYPAAPDDLSKPDVITYSGMNFEVITGGEAAIASALTDIGKIDATLKAVDASTFFSYSNLINLKSFINTYIINAYLQNFRNEPIKIYLVKKADGKIHMNPVWEFDYSIDNSVSPVNAEHAEAYNTVWFDRLILSSEFLRALERRYYELERGPLKYENVNNSAVMLYRELGDALWRDWARWEYEYTEDGRYVLDGRYSEQDNITLIRQTVTPEQDLIKIKHSLRAHGQNTKWKLKELPYRDGVYERVVHVRFDTSMALLFVLLFFLSVIYSRRKIKES